MLPRLPSIGAEGLLDELLRKGRAQWPPFDPAELPFARRFAATGGARASARELRTLHDGILASASRCGMGDESTRNEHAQFDCDVGVWLAQNDLIFDGAALRDEFWSFVGIVVASNVVLWRFGTSRERYLGAVRNTFQRLWLRARVLDRGAGSENRWQLLNDLTEDALVQIMERPSIGADPLLARSLAEAWVGAAVRFRKSKMEGVMRRATLRVRVQNEIRSLASLDSYSLASILDALFDAAADDSAGSANGSALSNVHGTVPSSSIPEEDKMLYEQPKGEIRPFPNTATRP